MKAPRKKAPRLPQQMPRVHSAPRALFTKPGEPHTPPQDRKQSCPGAPSKCNPPLVAFAGNPIKLDFKYSP